MRTGSIVATFCCVAVAGNVMAAPDKAPSVNQRIDVLSNRVDEALKTAAEVPSTLEALQKMQEELVYLQQAVQSQQAATRGYKQLRANADEITRRLDDLELRFSALLLQRAGAAGADPETGFAISSADERFRLAIGGLVQAEYGARFYSEQMEYPGTDFGEDQAGFALRRARIALSGHVGSPRARYRVAFQYGTVERTGVLDAWGELHLHRLVNLRVGLMRQPFGRQFTLWASDLLFVERGPVTLAHYPGRDVGVMISGEVLPDDEYGQISYRMGIFNGDPAAVNGEAGLSNLDTDFLYGARIAYDPLGTMSRFEVDRSINPRPKLQLAGSVYYNRVPTDAPERVGATDPAEIGRLLDQNADGEQDRVDVLGVGGELTAHYYGLGWQSELFYRQETLSEVDDKRSYWGAYSQLAAHLRWNVELAARYSYWNHRRYGHNEAIVAPDHTHEAAGMVAVLLWAQRVKLLVQYAHRWHRDLQGQQPGADNLQENELYVSSQIAF